MTQEELQAIRLVMREEIGASEQRTGERLDRLEARVARIDGRIDQLDNTQRMFHDDLILFKAEVRTKFIDFTTDTREEIRLFKTGVREDLTLFKTEMHRDLAIFKTEIHEELTTFKTEIREELTTFKTEADIKQGEVTSMLSDITTVINEMQADQRNLENKVDNTTLALRRDMQTLNEHMHEIKRGMQQSTQELVEMNRLTHQRLTHHENTPIGETHPRPPQPGTAA